MYSKTNPINETETNAYAQSDPHFISQNKYTPINHRQITSELQNNSINEINTKTQNTLTKPITHNPNNTVYLILQSQNEKQLLTKSYKRKVESHKNKLSSQSLYTKSNKIRKISKTKSLPNKTNLLLEEHSNKSNNSNLKIEDYSNSNKNPLHGEYSNKNPLHGEYSNKNPLNGEYSNKKPLNGEYSNKKPLHGEYSDKNLSHEEYSNKKPLHEEYSNKNSSHEEDFKTNLSNEDQSKQVIISKPSKLPSNKPYSLIKKKLKQSILKKITLVTKNITRKVIKTLKSNLRLPPS